jgi:hypothetical protein
MITGGAPVRGVAATLLAVFLLQWAAPASAFELITKEEAGLPDGTRTDKRGPFPGPTIEVVSPPPS